MILNIQCQTCSDKCDDEINFEFYKQEDDLIVMKCPICKTEIIYDDIKTNYIKIMEWLSENNWKLYQLVVKEYIAKQLE